MPRVGNQAFANYVDSTNKDLTHVTNKKDPVPTVPGEFLGFVHPSGEVHIENDESWETCPGNSFDYYYYCINGLLRIGQDNSSNLCSTGEVSNIFEGKVSDHDGPYDVVTMGC